MSNSNSTNDVVHIRFPNESYYDEILTFKLDEFIPIQEFECEVYGIWKNTNVAVMIEDYNRLRNEQK